MINQDTCKSCGGLAITQVSGQPYCYSCFQRRITPPKSEVTKAIEPTPPASDHYRSSIEPIDYILANNMGFLEGNVIKYVTRYKNKNGLEDLKKAKWYLEKLIEKGEGK